MLANLLEFAAFKMGAIKCMARIQLASNNDDVRGKIGGIVYSKGRSVHTQRKRVKPMNPQSSYQTLVRSYVRQFSVAWRALDPDNIIAWNEAALQVQKSNVFGGKYHTTGHKLFVAYNVEAFLNGATVQIDLPFTLALPSPVGLASIDPDSTGTPKFTVTLDANPTANSDVVVFATPQMSAGISNFKGKFRRIGQYAAADFANGATDIITEYTDRLGDLISGQKVAVQVYYTNTDATKKCMKFKAGAALAKSVK